MPITKAAKRALRVSARKREQNLVYIENYKKAVRDVRQAFAGKPEDTQKLILTAFAALDRAAKVNVIHKNKAANLKSKLHIALNKLTGNPVELKSLKEKPKKVTVKRSKQKTT